MIILLALIAVISILAICFPSKNKEKKSEVAAQTEVAEEKEDPKIAASTLLKVDSSLPAFSIEMNNGETISTDSFRGKVVLINFWATWCPPCRQELTRVQKDIIDRFEGRDFVFLPISRGEDKATVEEFLKKNGYTFPVGLDTDQSVFKLFATEYIPRNFLINRHGTVVSATVGYEAEEFDALVKHIEMTLNAR